MKSEKSELNLLDSLSINKIFNTDIDNNFQINEKDSIKDTINLNNNMSINNSFNNNPLNLSPQNNIKNSLFPLQNNNININNNSIYNNYNPGIILNPQNDIFINNLPKINNISNNLNLNTFNTGPKSIQNNNFGNEIRSNLFPDIDNKNNLEPKNLPFFQIAIQNPISMQQIPNNIVSNNIIPNSIPNNFLITNNNINTNSNININKNINNIINFDTKNIINRNINNNIKINSNQNLNTKINNKEINSNAQNFPMNTKIIFSSKHYNNKNTNTNSNNTTNNIQPKNTIIESKIPPKKITPLFNIKESSLSKEKEKLIKTKLTMRKRKRFIKNNKLVFVQIDKENDKKDNDKETELNEENKNEESLNSEKVSELINKNTKPRGSRYRGVSKNGSQWQVLIMVKKKKRYLGSFSNEEEAARAYDKVALQHHGIKAKTNYDYTKEEVKEIMEAPKLLKLD